MKPRTLHLHFLAAVIAALAMPLKAELLLDWNTQALSAIQGAGKEAPEAARELAMVSAAVYDAINGIDGGFTSYYVSGSGPAGGSMEAAASAAAKTVLEALYPALGSSFSTLYADQLATIADGQAKTDGINWGSQVATSILNWRAGDGASNAATTPYAPSGLIGRWSATPTATGPGYQFPPTLAGWGSVVPFVMTQGNQFRPATTIDTSSAAYATAYNEVKNLGAATGSLRTADQTTAAHVWSDAVGTYTAAGHWNQVAARMILSDGGLDLRTKARILAALNVAMADAAIAAWDASYANDNWRPVTGIAYGGDNVIDRDFNAATTGDEFAGTPDGWNPLIDTPPMPSFMNGNTAIAAAAADIFIHYLGNRSITVDADTDGDGLYDTTLDYASITDALADAGMSPVWAGTDFGYATAAGVAAGSGIGTYTTDNYFQPIAPVPEPSSLMMALGALAMLRRRRRQA